MNPLPCPFCGSSRLENFDGAYLKCIECQATGPVGGCSGGNVDRWNRRTNTIVAATHWQKGLNHRVWCGAEPELLKPPLALTLNLNTVTCVQCLRAGSAWAAEQLLARPGPDFDNQTPEKAHSDPNPRSGTSVQCGPITLNIPPAYKSTLSGQTLTIHSPDGKAAWSFEHVPPEQCELSAFSFST